jgi:hypothetical protein
LPSLQVSELVSEAEWENRLAHPGKTEGVCDGVICYVELRWTFSLL